MKLINLLFYFKFASSLTNHSIIWYQHYYSFDYIWWLSWYYKKILEICFQFILLPASCNNTEIQSVLNCTKYGNDNQTEILFDALMESFDDSHLVHAIDFSFCMRIMAFEKSFVSWVWVVTWQWRPNQKRFLESRVGVGFRCYLSG